jgi:hypothetical protein
VYSDEESVDWGFSPDEISTMVSILAKFIVAKGIGAENFTPQVKQTCLASLASLTLYDGSSVVECVLRCDGLAKELVRFANFPDDVANDASLSAVNILEFVCDEASDEELLKFFELAPLFLLTLPSLLLKADATSLFLCTICGILSHICRRPSLVLEEVFAAVGLISTVAHLARDKARCVEERFSAIRCIFHVFRGATSEQALHVIVDMNGLTAVMDLLQSEKTDLPSKLLLEALEIISLLMGDKLATVASWDYVAEMMDARNFWNTLVDLRKHRNQNVSVSASQIVKDDFRVAVVQREGNEV